MSKFLTLHHYYKLLLIFTHKNLEAPPKNVCCGFYCVHVHT